MKTYEVAVECTSVEVFRIEAESAQEAEENFDEGTRIQDETYDRTIIGVEEKDE